MSQSVHPSGENAASLWAVRLAAGELSTQEEQDLAAWLSEDERHAHLLCEFQRLYFRAGEAVPRLVQAGKLRDVTAAVARPHRGGRGGWWRALMASAAAVALAVTAGLWWQSRPEQFETLAAQRQSLVLADGSRIDLNARTGLAAKQGERSREVWLKSGEAYFEVMPDAARPFVVHTEAGSVRVVGTRFNVRTSGAGQLEVTVTEGRVEVAPGDRRGAQVLFALQPNDQFAFDGAKVDVRKLPVEVAEDVIAWRSGWVVFDRELLGSAVQRFAAYHGRRVEIAPEAAGLEIGGRFKLDALDEFLRDLEHTLPVTVLRAGERCRIVARAGNQ